MTVTNAPCEPLSERFAYEVSEYTTQRGSDTSWKRSLLGRAWADVTISFSSLTSAMVGCLFLLAA